LPFVCGIAFGEQAEDEIVDSLNIRLFQINTNLLMENRNCDNFNSSQQRSSAETISQRTS